MGTYDDLISGLMSVDPHWKSEQNDKLLARLLMAALFQEAISATTAARSKGTRVELRDRATSDGFELALHPRAVTFIRTNKGVDISVSGTPRIGWDHTLVPEMTFDAMREQAIHEMTLALEFLI